MEMESLNGPRVGLRLVFEDKGPGIPESNWLYAMVSPPVPGWAWALSGAKRLVNEFELIPA